MQRTRVGQVSDFAPHSFALLGSSCHWCALQSGQGLKKRGNGEFGCYRVKCVEVVDLDELLGKHDSPCWISDAVKRRRPGGKTNHVGNNHQHNARHSRLGGQTNLIRSVSLSIYISENLECKLAGVVVHATAVHEAEHVLDSFVGENPFPGDRTDSPVGKGACHHWHALAVHLQAASLERKFKLVVAFLMHAYLEVKVKDVLDVDSTTSVVWSIGETSLFSHEVCQSVVSVRSVPECKIHRGFKLNVFLPFWEERRVLETNILSSSHPDEK